MQYAVLHHNRLCCVSSRMHVDTITQNSIIIFSGSVIWRFNGNTSGKFDIKGLVISFIIDVREISEVIQLICTGM